MLIKGEVYSNEYMEGAGVIEKSTGRSYVFSTTRQVNAAFRLLRSKQVEAG